MWDLVSGKPLDILTGDQAAKKTAAAQAWRDAGSASGNIVVKSDDNTVAELVSTKMSTALARIYIAPPCQIDCTYANTCRVSLPTKRLAFFTTSRTFLVYEVDM